MTTNAEIEALKQAGDGWAAALHYQKLSHEAMEGLREVEEKHRSLRRALVQITKMSYANQMITVAVKALEAGQ